MIQINNKVIRLLTGAKNIWNKKWKALFPISFAVAVFVIWCTMKENMPNIDIEFLSKFWILAFNLMMITIAIIGESLIISMLGTPLSAKKIEKCLANVGFKDRTGNTPMLLSKFQEGKAKVYEFYSTTIPITEYEKKSADIETALNVCIIGIESGKDFQHVYVKTVTANKNLPEILKWNNSKIPEDDGVLLLGESQLSTVTADLKVTPHILIGGSSGSGKSVLLKLLLMQCIKKGYEIYMADFKGGVDYPQKWHERCNMRFTIEGLVKTLADILEALEDRKRIFRE